MNPFVLIEDSNETDRGPHAPIPTAGEFHLATFRALRVRLLPPHSNNNRANSNRSYDHDYGNYLEVWI
jgi:hypothetical protein